MLSLLIIIKKTERLSFNFLLMRAIMENRDDVKSFYEFDDANNEIVFHRHDMPTPWMNYLTNGVFYTMISQAGGNLSWYKSPAIGVSVVMVSLIYQLINKAYSSI